MPIKTGYWIQVVGGTVQQVWDRRPPQDKIEAEPGWQEAVEVMPDTIPGREAITTHSFDLSVTPPQIVWAKREIDIDERKSSIKVMVKNSFDRIVKEELQKELDEFLDTHYNAEVVESARQLYLARIAQINSLATHEEIDAFMKSINT